MFQKASESLENQTSKEKFIGSETFGISEELLPKAFELCEEFLQKFATLAQSKKTPNQVYHLGLQFFNLTKGSK